MQSKILGGARRLLLAAGVITLVLSVVAPAAVSASNAGGSAQGQENGQGQSGQGQSGQGQNEGHDGQGQEHGQGHNGQGGQQTHGGEQTWVCHATASATNPWEVLLVDGSADPHLNPGHEDDRWFAGTALDELAAWAGTTGVDLGAADLRRLDQLVTGEPLAQLMALCDGLDEDDTLDDDITEEDDDDIKEEDVIVDDDTTDDDDDTTDDDDDTTDDDDDTTDDDDDQGDDEESEDPQGPRQPLPIQVSDDDVTPPAPLPEPQISADEVVAPAVPTPAGNPEVLGVTTTRTPTRELASAGLTSLPRTGTDSTTILALVGGLLVATGLGLEALGRRGRLAAVGGRR